MINGSNSLIRNSGKLFSGAVLLSNSTAYRTMPAYTDVDTNFAMMAINPRLDSGVMAYHKWATPDVLYQVRLCWFGGQAPFRVTIVNAPTGAYLGSGGLVQTMVKTADATVPALNNYGLAQYSNTISWQPLESDTGTTKYFLIVVEDNKGNTLYFRWNVTIDRTKFITVDASGGLDANDGSWLTPKQTFAAAHVIPNKIMLLKNGTYAITSTAIYDSANTIRQFIGVGNNVVFNMTQQQFGTSGLASDIAFINITFDGSMNNGDNRIFNLGSRCVRALWWKCKWTNATAGTTHNDNPACIFLANLGGPSTGTELASNVRHEYIALVECSVDASVGMQMLVTFATTGVLVENCVGMYGSTTTYHNGAHFIHLKDQTCSFSVRFNYCEGITGDSAIQVANQSAWHCHRQEVCYNVVSTTTEPAIRWNVQNTVAGNPAIGQTIGATKQYMYRNTFIANSGWQQIPQYLAGSEPVVVSNNLIISAAASITAGAGYTLLGDNASRAVSYIDGNKKISNANRAALAGKVGAEIASN